MTVPPDYRYSKEHEWVRREGATALVGITHFAQDQLGDIVFLSLPPAGSRVAQFQKMGEVESVKSVADLFAPVTGHVVAVNPLVLEHPELVNQEPYGQGWLIRVSLPDPAELERLLSARDYEAFLAANEA